MPTHYRLIILINYLPFVHLVSGLAIGCFLGDWNSRFLFGASWIYLLPPIACRIGIWILGTPNSQTKIGSRDFFAWWLSCQWQNIFARFPFFEEVLRMIPGVYTGWLRLWGAKIGKYTYWSANSRILDRSFIEMGDFVIVGYGARITSHLFHMAAEDSYFIFGTPRIGSYAVLGGDCGIGPGAVISERQTVPAGAYVTPFKKKPREFEVPQ